MKSILYGVRSSGNQAEKALRMTADFSKDTHPEVYRIIHEDLYADDCLSGCQDFDEAYELADGMEEVLEKTKFYTKGFSFSKRAPNPEISKDGESINVAGYKWFTEKDKVQLNIKPITFPRTMREKKRKSAENSEIPKHLKRVQCASKVGEIFRVHSFLLQHLLFFFPFCKNLPDFSILY